MPTSRIAVVVVALVVLTACGGTRTLEMPPPGSTPSPSGEAIDLVVSDGRETTVLGKVDAFTIESGPSLAEYVEVELLNGLARAGVTAWQRTGTEQSAGPSRKRLVASIVAVRLEAESTLLYPVLASVKIGIELTNEVGQTTYQRDLRGTVSRELGFHTQGGHEDAALLGEAITKAVSKLSSDESFAAALAVSAEEAERSLASEEAARSAARVNGRQSIEDSEASEGRAAMDAVAGPLPGGPDACTGGHSVASLADDGRLVVLEDGSRWEVDLVDTVDSALWEKGEGVLLCGSRMINIQSGERVSVSPPR